MAGPNDRLGSGSRNRTPAGSGTLELKAISPVSPRERARANNLRENCGPGRVDPGACAAREKKEAQGRRIIRRGRGNFGREPRSRSARVTDGWAGGGGGGGLIRWVDARIVVEVGQG